MTSWRTLNADNLPLISALETVAQTIQGPIEAMAAATTTAASTLSLLERTMLRIPDPTAAARAAIDGLITDIVESRVSVLLLRPKMNFIVRGYDGFGRLLDDSLEDLADVNRPQFGPGDTVTGFVVLASAPSFAELAPIAELFQKTFIGGWEEIVDGAVALASAGHPQRNIYTAGIVSFVPEDADPRVAFVDRNAIRPRGEDPFTGRRIRMMTGRNANITAKIQAFSPSQGLFTTSGFPADLRQGDGYVTMYGHNGRPPDWQSVRLVDVIPPIGHAVNALAILRDAIGPQDKTVALLAKIVDVLERKARFLQNLVARVRLAIDQLAALGDLTNVSFLPIQPNPYGNFGISRAYYTARLKPAISPTAAVVAIAVVGGSGLVAPLTTLFGPLYTD